MAGSRFSPPLNAKLYCRLHKRDPPIQTGTAPANAGVLPVGLREHISLRNVEAVAALSPQAQTCLLEAVQAGPKRLPRAIEQLRADPQISVAELLIPPTQIESVRMIFSDQNSIAQTVPDLNQECSSDMSSFSAEAFGDCEQLIPD